MFTRALINVARFAGNLTLRTKSFYNPSRRVLVVHRIYAYNKCVSCVVVVVVVVARLTHIQVVARRH